MSMVFSLADSHHGFRPMHSIPTATLKATNDWYLKVNVSKNRR